MTSVPPGPHSDLDYLLMALAEYKRLADQAARDKNIRKHLKFRKKHDSLLGLIWSEYPHTRPKAK